MAFEIRSRNVENIWINVKEWPLAQQPNQILAFYLLNFFWKVMAMHTQTPLDWILTDSSSAEFLLSMLHGISNGDKNFC